VSGRASWQSIRRFWMRVDRVTLLTACLVRYPGLRRRVQDELLLRTGEMGWGGEGVVGGGGRGVRRCGVGGFCGGW